jgi:integrase
MGIDTETNKPPYYTKFGLFDVRKITAIEINSYVKERLKTVGKLTVLRELTMISNVFTKLQWLNRELVKLENPTFTYDKTLTEDSITKRTFTYSAEDEKLLFETLDKVENRTYYNVAKICILTAMRRSEAVLLAKSQIQDNTISLKSKGKFRKIYMTSEARKFIETLPILNDDKDRFFRMTVGGFEKMYRSYFRDKKLKHLQRSHDLRRTNISRLITSIGLEHSVVLTEILGIQNVGSFEKNWSHKVEQKAPTTQQEAMKSYGHGFAQSTKGYFNFNVGNMKFTVKKKD